ncbi:cytochrome c [Afifella sp. JA880]|uniref:c-type cytochrome n=1 Tax=Afifella sp. JA880 TaxID=2975280 RepID=UPI0021BA9B16|nr:cytochrome c [Afifella sp. JA880]MCT8266276.1 cytochrome c [Afifella sp. JA880]
MRTFAALILAVAAVLAGGALAVYFVFTGPGTIPPATIDFTKLTHEERARMVERGRYVARAADCGACHMSQDGVALAGGLPMETPFGTLYGTNITPSRDHGIGNWTADDLYRALVWGINPDGSHLYPAMPYTSYHYMTRADVDALFIYLMAQRPIDKPDHGPDLTFPFNIRPAVAFWNLVYRPDGRELPEAADKPELWHRGRYLVDVAGHCGECHTPRNIAFAKTNEHLKGEVMEGALAPDISATGLVRRGWEKQDLGAFLKDGLSPQGTMTFRMYPVLSHSTKYLKDDDIDAVVTYLMDGAERTGVSPVKPALADGQENGRHLYVGLCAGCHGIDGEGQPHASVPLDTNTTAMLDNPLNLIRIISEGVPARPLGGHERMQEMPAFADRLTDRELADLANYLRERWGGQPPDIDASEIAELLAATSP